MEQHLTAFKRETSENQTSYTGHIVTHMREVTNLKPAKGQGKAPSRTTHPNWRPVKDLLVMKASSGASSL